MLRDVNRCVFKDNSFAISQPTAYQQEDFGDRWADRRIGMLTLSTGECRDLSLPGWPENCLPKPSGVDYLN